MLKTIFIPLIVGLVCAVLASILLNLILPSIQIDDAMKGLLKLAVFIISAAIPAEFLRSKAKKEQLNKNSE